MKKKISSAVALSYLVPVLVFAQGTSITDILDIVTDILNVIIPLIITIALIYFLWGVVGYIMKQGDEEGQKAARAHMVNGIIALFVILSVWGLVAVLNSTFGIEAGGAPEAIPEGPTAF